MHRIAPAVIVATLATTSALAADPEQGGTLAKRWCATCHLVGADQNGPKMAAPPLAAVAKRPEFHAAEIASFLVERHRKLHSLTGPEAADIAAYIATLK
jgi:mono/diheme cytochrome c family protein